MYLRGQVAETASERLLEHGAVLDVADDNFDLSTSKISDVVAFVLCFYLLAMPIELEVEIPLIAGERDTLLRLDVARQDLLGRLVGAVTHQPKQADLRLRRPNDALAVRLCAWASCPQFQFSSARHYVRQGMDR